MADEARTADIRLHPPWPIRTLFISDVHLGYRGCKAQELVGLLNHVQALDEKTPLIIYIVGDGIDGYSLGIKNFFRHFRKFFKQRQGLRLKLPQDHLDVCQKLLRHARRGAFIINIVGNHDDFLRPFLKPFPDLSQQQIDRQLSCLENRSQDCAPLSPPWQEINGMFDEMMQLGRIFFMPPMNHITADGKTFLMQHGDEFDGLIRGWRHSGFLGTKTRDLLFSFSEWLSRNDDFPRFRQILRRLLGVGEGFSLADHIHTYKGRDDLMLPTLALRFIETKNELILEKRATHRSWCEQPLYDGIICGHNHQPEMKIVPASGASQTIQYINCGDWVSNCTACVELADGSLKLVKWDSAEGIQNFPDDRKMALPVKYRADERRRQVA